MQNKQAIIGIVAAAIILLGAGGVFLYSQKKSASKPQPNSTTTATSVTKTPSSMMSGSLKDLFAGGKTSQCTFDVKGASGETKGTVYVADTKAYGDFDMTSSNGKTTATYMIRNGDTFYVWGDSFPTGMKMTMSMDEMASKMQGSTQYKSLDPNQKTDYKCTDWTADASKFTPPSNVKFTDLGGMMIKTTGGPTIPSTTGTAPSCSVCDSLTGTTKAACRASLHCSP